MYNYTWNKHTREDYATFGADEKKATVPARIPITALIEGESCHLSSMLSRKGLCHA